MKAPIILLDGPDLIMTEHYLEFIASIAVATRPVMLVGTENMNS